MKSRIVFYRRRDDLPAGVEDYCLSGSLAVVQREQLLCDFEAKTFDTLYVPSGMTHGWRTRLTDEECEVVFLGDGWREEEIAQGSMRTAPSRFLVPSLSPRHSEIFMTLAEAFWWVGQNCQDEEVLQRLRSRRVARTLADEVVRLQGLLDRIAEMEFAELSDEDLGRGE